MADNITIKDGSGASVTLKTKDVGAGVECSQSIPTDTSGNSILGTAGTANANVLTVQGIASGTAAPVSVASLPLPAGAATAANQTSPQTPIAPAAATATVGWVFGGQYNSTQATFTNGQQGAIQISSRGEVKSNIMDAAGNARGANVNASNQLSVTVDNTPTIGTVTPGTGATNLGKAEDSVHTSADVGVFSLAVGNEAQTVLAQDGDYIAHAVDTKGNALVVGNVASAAADAGNPVKVGGVYNSTPPTYTTGQRANWSLNSRGIAMVELASGGFSTAIFGNGGDGASNNVNVNIVVSYSSVFNGTTWDRQRTIITGTNSIGTGIVAAGIVAQLDDVSPTAITENQFGNVRMGAERGLYISPLASTIGGYSFLHIAAGQATTTVKSGAGTLHSIVLNSAATATNVTTVYDNTAGSGTVIAIPAVTTATVPTTLIFDIAFATGLTIVTATANGGDMTVTYK